MGGEVAGALEGVLCPAEGGGDEEVVALFNFHDMYWGRLCVENYHNPEYG